MRWNSRINVFSVWENHFVLSLVFVPTEKFLRFFDFFKKIFDFFKSRGKEHTLLYKIGRKKSKIAQKSKNVFVQSYEIFKKKEFFNVF